MTPKTQKRIARVQAALTALVRQQERAAAKKPTASAKPAAAKKPVVRPQRTALAPEGGGAAVPDVKKISPVLNNIDHKTKAMDSHIDALLSAIGRKNVNNVKSLLNTLMKNLKTFTEDAGRLEKFVPASKVASAKSVEAKRVLAKARLAAAKARKFLNA